MAAPDAGASNAATRKAPDLALTRVFDAPREVVFKVWTDPRHVPQWWGPRGFQTTVHEMDVRPGAGGTRCGGPTETITHSMACSCRSSSRSGSYSTARFLATRTKGYGRK